MSLSEDWDRTNSVGIRLEDSCHSREQVCLHIDVSASGRCNSWPLHHKHARSCTRREFICRESEWPGKRVPPTLHKALPCPAFIGAVRVTTKHQQYACTIESLATRIRHSLKHVLTALSGRCNGTFGRYVTAHSLQAQAQSAHPSLPAGVGPLHACQYSCWMTC